MEDNNQEVANLLTVNDIAKRLNISKPYVYKLASEMKIKHYRFGKTIRFSEQNYKDFLSNSVKSIISI